jgi:hypothetical protein
MLYAIIEEIWSTSLIEEERKLLSRSAPLESGDKDLMLQRAQQQAGKFERHGYERDAIYPYWWGRNAYEQKSHRFVVMPVLADA